MKENQMNKPMKSLLYRFLIPLFMAMPALLMAQQITPDIVSSAGGTFTNGAITLTFSIGEPVTETFSEGNITLTQGFLQGLSGKIGIKENSSKEQQFTLYPNPVSEKLYLRNSKTASQGIYEIKDLQGKTLCRGTITGVLSDVPVNIYAPGLYLISIQLNNKQPENKLFIKR